MQSTDQIGKKINEKCQLQPCWVWCDKVTELVKSYIKGYSLNCPCGLSTLGNVRADAVPHGEGIIKADMEALPFEDNTFDTVISDPPWKIDFHERRKPFYEAVRVCKVGGTIIYNCTWRPHSKHVRLKECIVRTDVAWGIISAIWIFEKISEPEKAVKTETKD